MLAVICDWICYGVCVGRTGVCSLLECCAVAYCCHKIKNCCTNMGHKISQCCESTKISLIDCGHSITEICHHHEPAIAALELAGAAPVDSAEGGV